MQFHDLHSFHPTKTIQGTNGGVSPLRPDLKQQDYVQQKKDILAAERTANNEAEARLQNARIAGFFNGLARKLREKSSARGLELPIWGK